MLKAGNTGEGDGYLQPQHPLPHIYTAAPGPAAVAFRHPPSSLITCNRDRGFWGHWLFSHGWLRAPGVPWAPQGCSARLVGCRGQQQGAGPGSHHGKCCRQDVYPAAGWELHCSWSSSGLRQWGLEAPLFWGRIGPWSRGPTSVPAAGPVSLHLPCCHRARCRRTGAWSRSSHVSSARGGCQGLVLHPPRVTWLSPDSAGLTCSQSSTSCTVIACPSAPTACISSRSQQLHSRPPYCQGVAASTGTPCPGCPAPWGRDWCSASAGGHRGRQMGRVMGAPWWCRGSGGHDYPPKHCWG